jgi:hypothetical protein
MLSARDVKEAAENYLGTNKTYYYSNKVINRILYPS